MPISQELFENCFLCHAVTIPLCLKVSDKGLFLPFAMLRKLFSYSSHFLMSKYLFQNNISIATYTVWVENCLIKKNPLFFFFF